MQVANVNLPIQVTGRHVSVSEPMKAYAIKKVEGLHLDYPRIIEAQVVLDVQKYRHSAEVLLLCANHISIEASAETTDMYASIDQVMDKIARRMRKYKTRIMRQHRPRKGEVRHVEEQVFSLDGLDLADLDAEPSVVQTEKYPVKPMYVDEAILQLEMSNRQFVVFHNAKNDRINVVYRRKDNGVGVIEPVFS
ncbi:MAG TPA: ribosome-associated translation inhibitor RaiA [Chthoniobacteraceae bacterium]|nr:ribosome-associated translation inhibitor RaiA [Chthoniobacteraceae bacterium]